MAVSGKLRPMSLVPTPSPTRSPRRNDATMGTGIPSCAAAKRICSNYCIPGCLSGNRCMNAGEDAVRCGGGL